MNYIQKAYLGKTAWWRYIVTILLVITGIAIFSIPHTNAIALMDIDPSKSADFKYLMSLFDLNTNLVYLLLPFVGGLLFLLLSVKFIHGQQLLNITTTRSKIDWNRVLFSFSIWAAIIVLTLAIQYLLAPKSLVLNFDLQPFLILCVLAIFMIPIQTSFEEYAFRGYLMQGLGVLSKTKWFPLLVTSLLFGLMHIGNPEIEKIGKMVLIYYIGTGLFLGVITLMDDGIELCLGFHAANNLVTALLVSADWTAFQTHSIFKDLLEPSLQTAVIPPIMMYPILLYVFSKKYKWVHWKEKLTASSLQPMIEKTDETTKIP